MSEPIVRAERGLVALAPPAKVRRLFDRLEMLHAHTAQVRAQKHKELERVAGFLGIAAAVEEALDHLSQALFRRIGDILEDKLTIALQEVLEQAITLKVTRDYKWGGVTMRFHVERDGQAEDIMKGQGGSVANILSVGLRLLALQTLDLAEHRRFLVLDEQDCWLHPDLVPRLVQIVQQAGRALGFQVLMISHHDIRAFERYADKIYQFIPSQDGVQVREVFPSPKV